MTNSFTTTTFATTYKDDFKDSDNYHRILFNSGRTLQARELTQMQTIIQEEIRRFGTNIFKEGGKVNGGNLTLNKREFIKLASGQLPATPSTLVGETFNASGIKVKVKKVVEATGSDPDTLYVEYVDTLSATAGTTPIRVAAGGTLVHTGGSISSMTIASSDATGQGLEASVSKGSFYVQGHFVFSKDQSVFVSKYTINPTEELGFNLVQDIVTETDDDDLYDNQGAAPNLTAPGAHRYRIQLTLAIKSSLAADDNFVFLAKIVNGKQGEQVTYDNSYNIIQDTLALRTKEESGNYIVKPFNARFNALNDSNLSLEVTDGIAYVDGYRISVPAKDITVNKAQTTLSVDGETVIPQYGNYVLFDSNYNLLEHHAEVNLRDTAAAGGSKIGTARIRHYEEDGADYRAYLYDIKMDAGKNFADTKSISNGASDYINVKLESSKAVLKSTSNNTLLFPLPSTRPSSIAYTSSNDIAVQKKYTVTTNASGVLASNQAISGGDTFTSTSSWVATRTDGTIDDDIVFNIALGTPTGSEFNITSGADNNQTYDIYTLQTLKGPTNFSAKTKSLAAEQQLTLNMSTDLDSDGNGTEFLSLRKADIYKVEEIALNSAGGTDISNFFDVDNGQRDNFYGIGRLVKKSGVSLPSGNAYIRFRHFTHSTSGSHFDVTSYPTGDSVGYSGIPDYRRNDGQTINLRDVLDFRPVAAILADSAGIMKFTFDSAGGGSQITPLLPVSGDTFDVNATYYLPRADRLVAITQDERGRVPDGTTKVIKGVPALDPQLPEIPEGSIPLYNINLNPFTLNESDLSTAIVPAKRFTMADIAELENRIDELTELTALSLLENATEALTVVDSAGLERTKAGFIADNFRDYSFSDINREEYRAGVSPVEGILTPEVIPNNVRLTYDSANSTTNRGPLGVTGDLITLPIDSNHSFIDQPLATETENVNPFAVLTGEGIITMSPTSDNWIERRQAPDQIVDGGDETSITRRIRRPIWTFERFRNLWFGEPTGGRVLLRGRVSIRREIIGNRVIDVSVIPFMRSRKIFFRVDGLRPRTQYFPFFGGTDIADFTRAETTFQRFASRQDDNSNVFNGRTSHPDGSSDLTSDSSGSLIGSFIIPNNSTTKFRSGQQEFKLLDISANNDDAAVTLARTQYTAQGHINTVQNIVRTTRVQELTELRQGDPLAQSFFVDQVENPNGVFLSKVRIFFATKDDSIPVRVQVRGVENGTPVPTPLDGAESVVLAANVNIPSDLTDLDNIRSNGTDFVFDEPIYLTPGREYAIVVLAESTDYTVHVAKTYDFLIGSTEARVNKQPTLGSLFMSQNSSTWTPDQERDLMFQIYRANFTTSGTAKLKNATGLQELLDPNPMQTTNASDEVRVFMDGHGFAKNDKVFISGLVDSGDFGGLFGASITGSRTITKVDHTGFTFDADSNATSSVRVGGSNVIVTRNMMYDAFVPQVQTLLPSDATAIAASVKKVSGSSYATDRNTGPTYAKDGSFSNITLNEFNTNQSPNVILNDSNESVHSITDQSFEMNLSLTTTDTKVSPVIDLQRASLAVFENIIDKQDASATNGFNVPISFVDETDRTEGTHAAKHVTTAVVLDEPAVGINILFAANRPGAAGFRVYFKTGTSDDNLDDIAYTEIAETTSNPADEDGTTFREYQYLAGGQVGNLNAFTQYQVKIVMTTTNSSKVPTIRDLRAIALVT